GYVEKERLAPADALRLACESGALPVLAHPNSLELSPPALRSRLEELRELGLVGAECVYGRYSPDERASLRALVSSLGLVVTGGSDHHGTYKPDLSVGTRRGALDAPDTAP